MPPTPCGCRLVKCTDNYDPSFADNLGVWWQVRCGCRLYPCVDEVTSHSPSPASSRESSTAPVAAQFLAPHDTSREPFPDGRRTNLDWPSNSDPLDDLNLTYNPHSVLESDLADGKMDYCECGNVLSPYGICLYHRPLYPRPATHLVAADLVSAGPIRHHPMNNQETHGPLLQNPADIGPLDTSNVLSSESTRIEGMMGSSSLNQTLVDMGLLPGLFAEGNAGGGVRLQFESGVNVPEPINQTIARGDPNSTSRTFDHSWNFPAPGHRQPMRLLGSDLLDRRRLQREIDTTREQLRQVEKERDDLKTQLQNVTGEDLVDENAAFLHYGFLADHRSAEVSSELNNPSSDRLDSDDAVRRSSFNRGLVNDRQLPQSHWRRPLNHRPSFASTQDDSLTSKSLHCCCTCITSANARPSTFPSPVNLEGGRLFHVNKGKYCGWCIYREQLECDHNSLFGETEASSFSTPGIAGSTPSNTSRTDARQAWNDPYAVGQYLGNRSSIFRPDHASGRLPRALHCHDCDDRPYGYDSHIRRPRHVRNLSMCGCRFGGARIRPRSLTLPSTMPRSAPYFSKHPSAYRTSSGTRSSRALSSATLPTWLMLTSYPILAALVALVATTPVETVEVGRVSGVFIGLVGCLAVSSWLVWRNVHGKLARRK